jgi:hypothetical protein
MERLPESQPGEKHVLGGIKNIIKEQVTYGSIGARKN